MQTGKRFWQLIGLVFFILLVYGLMELSDAVVARQTELKSQQQLLSRQETLLLDNHWPEHLRSANQVHKAWLSYLPVEKSPTFAKAHLLSDLRNIAKEAGIVNLTVTATDAEGGDKFNEKNSDKVNSAYAVRPVARFGVDKKKEDLLPADVQMIKLTIAGRFDPVAFNKLLKKQADAQRFSVVERISVRGVQLELGIRCYWRVESNLNTSADGSVANVIQKSVMRPIQRGV